MSRTVFRARRTTTRVEFTIRLYKRWRESLRRFLSIVVSVVGIYANYIIGVYRTQHTYSFGMTSTRITLKYIV